jgi:dihydroorotate dehydrogenase electron transfer subunit
MKDRIQELARVETQTEIAEGIYSLRFRSGAIASRARPGQFVNVLLRDGHAPLLRRPFSISSVSGETVTLVYNIIGRGTRMMATKRPGDDLDVLGPLGQPFRVDDSFRIAIIVAGGLGVAPFPYLTEALEQAGKTIRTYLGARTAAQIVPAGLRDVRVATDDGSAGYRGTVVALLEEDLRKDPGEGMKIFSCGPTPMMKALGVLAEREAIPCEVSLEGDMACGIGLCQGCPVERRDGDKKYALVCVDGPTFRSSEIKFP